MQCIATVLSADLVIPHDILAINGVSAALMVSPLPFIGPIGAVRIGLIDGELVVNPTLEETEHGSDLDLIVVGTKDGLTMVEAGANQVPESTMLEALDLAHREIVKLCEAQEELRAQAGKPKWLDPAVTEELEDKYGQEIWTRIQEQGLSAGSGSSTRWSTQEAGTPSMSSTEADVLRELQTRMSLAQILEKQRSVAVEAAVREQFEADLRALTEAEQDSKELKSAKRTCSTTGSSRGRSCRSRRAARSRARRTHSRRATSRKACESIYKDLVRKKIAVEKRRPDGRSETEIRPIDVEVSVRPRTHGSGLFTRGQTQIMSLLTLGTAKEGQRIDDLSLETDRRYMHHYNFPPYSVGETGRMGSPSAATSATGRSPSGRSRRSSRPRRTSRTRSASSRRRSSRTARRRWARCAARRSP